MMSCSLKNISVSAEINSDCDERNQGLGRTIRKLAIFSILCLIAHPVKAAQYGMTMQGGVRYTSNVNQTPIPLSDIYVNYLWTGMYSTRTPRLKADLKGSVSANYLMRSNEDTILPSGDANILYTLAKQRLDWVLQDRIQVVRIDTLQGDIPSNQEIANVFVTGPNGLIRLSAVDKLLLEARYESADFQTSTNKNSINYGQAYRWVHELTPSSTISANYEVKDVKSTENYIRHDEFLSYTKTSSRHSFTLNGGNTKVETAGGINLSEPNYSLEYTYQSNSTNSWTLSGSHRFSDTTDAIITPINLSDPLTRNPGIFLQDLVTFGLKHVRGYKSLTADIYQRHRDYVLASLFEDGRGLSVNYTQRIGQAHIVNLHGSTSDLYYSDTLATDTEAEVGGDYSFNINRDLTWNIGILYRNRRSPVAIRNFDENVIFTYLILKRTSLRP